MTDIGRAGIVMKGDYNSASTYETLDAVSYQNGLYIAKQNVPAGTVPTNTTYWQLATGGFGSAASKNVATGISSDEQGLATGAQIYNNILDSGDIAIEETTVPTSTFTTIHTFTAPIAGRYILNTKVTILDTSSDSALRILVVSTDPNAENTNISEYVLNTGRCVSEITKIITLSAGDTLYIRYYQTTGSSQVAYGKFRCMKF